MESIIYITVEQINALAAIVKDVTPGIGVQVTGHAIAGNLSLAWVASDGRLYSGRITADGSATYEN
jgi:hypothetical protein